jgi:hypothetical protein
MQIKTLQIMVLYVLRLFCKASVFEALSQNSEKRLLASSRPYVRPFVRIKQLGSHLTDL